MASLICDVTTDIWLVGAAELTPVCSFLLTVEFFILALQANIKPQLCLEVSGVSFQIYSVYSVLQLSSVALEGPEASPHTKLEVQQNFDNRYPRKVELRKLYYYIDFNSSPYHYKPKQFLKTF